MIEMKWTDSKEKPEDHIKLQKETSQKKQIWLYFYCSAVFPSIPLSPHKHSGEAPMSELHAEAEEELIAAICGSEEIKRLYLLLLLIRGSHQQEAVRPRSERATAARCRMDPKLGLEVEALFSFNGPPAFSQNQS